MSEASWRESKVACCLTLQTKAQGVDPQPEPPSKFLEPTEAARLASEVKRRSRPATERNEEQSRREEIIEGEEEAEETQATPQRNRKRTRVRTVVATMENSEAFGWQVAAEVHRRGLDRAKRKACVCDGQAYNWSIYEMHLLPAGFIAILDFLHLLAYLYDAAHAYRGSDAAQGWKTYEQWLRWAWSGKVGPLLSSLACRGRGVGEERFGRGSQKGNSRRDVDLRDEQPRTHGLSRVPPPGPAHQQRPGGVDDQADQPPRQRQREILAGRRRRSDPAIACGPIEPRRPLEQELVASP